MELILRADTTLVSLYHFWGKLIARASDVKSNIPQSWFDIFSGLISVRVQFGEFLTFLSSQIRSSTWQKQKQKPQSQRRTTPANVQTTEQLCSFHTLARLCSKSFKQVSAVCEPRTSRCANWVWKRQRNQGSNCQHPLDHGKSKRVPEKHLFLLYWLPKPLTVWITINCGKFFKRWEYQTT